LFSQEHRHKCTQLRQGKTDAECQEQLDKEREKFFEKMKTLNSELKKKEEKLELLSQQDVKAIYAFVTFNRVVDRTTVLDKYRKMSFYTWLCNNAHLKLKHHFLQVIPAPEPSVIIWENLAHSTTNRVGRRIFTTLSTLLLVGFSLIMIFSSKVMNDILFFLILY
jgi:hypothetical protein